MKPSKIQLYDALGELIYAVAKADGLVQESEVNKLVEVLKHHPWAKDVQWSFDYESKKSATLVEVYEKAIDICKQYGPTEEFGYLVEILRAVAEASEGIESSEAAIIDRFQTDLKNHFLEQNYSIEDLDSNE